MHLDITGMCEFRNSYNLVLWEYGPIESIFQRNYFRRGTDERSSLSKAPVIEKRAQHVNISGDDDVLLNIRKSEVVL